MSKIKFKSLYEFSVPKLVEVEEVSFATDDAGAELKTVKKVKKEQPQTFYIKRPNRNEYDEAELFYNKKVGEALSSGLISNALLAKRIDGDGGLISLVDKESLTKLQTSLTEKKKELEESELDKESAEYIGLKSEVDDLETKFSNAARNYGALESSIFEVTAESWAKNKVARWWLLRLLHTGDQKPFFAGANDEERLETFYELEDSEGEEKTFLSTVVFKSMLAIAYWRQVGTIDAEELDKLSKESEDKSNTAKAT